MNDKQRFELAEKLKQLRDEKKELEASVKNISAEIESTQAELIADLMENESSGFNHKGFNYALVVKEYPSPEPERKDDLWAAMREQGFDALFTINSQTLSATVKDLKAENDDELPSWLNGLIKVAEKTTIQIRKGRKV